MEFLSLSTCDDLVRSSVVGAPQLSAPSVDRLTSRPLSLAPNGVEGWAGFNTREKKNAVPSGAKVTHGSDARAKVPPVHSVTPFGIVSDQVPPLSVERLPVLPRAPPLSQRSCW